MKALGDASVTEQYPVWAFFWQRTCATPCDIHIRSDREEYPNLLHLKFVGILFVPVSPEAVKVKEIARDSRQTCMIVHRLAERGASTAIAARFTSKLDLQFLTKFVQTAKRID